MTRLMTAILGLLCLAALAAAPAAAQSASGGPFSPRVIVNGKAVTNWEITQRARMLRVFGTPGNLEELALEALIDDRLRMAAADAAGLRVGVEDVERGIEELASRANITGDEFLRILNSNGVATETVRDFVIAGLAWREVVRSRFLSRAQITETEIDRALAQTTGRAVQRVLLSEIVVRPEARSLIERLQRDTRGPAAFAAAAQRHSVAGTAAAGGARDWVPVSALPAEVAEAVAGLSPGQISRVVETAGGLAIYQLRARDVQATGQAAAIVVEYAQFLIPEGPDAAAQAQRVAERVDTCDDLYGVAKGLPEERLIRDSVPEGAIPADIAGELARLDAGEVSTALVRGGARVVLMLCGRTPSLEDAPSREAIRDQLRNQRLAAYADGYLEELRTDAIILRP